MTKKKMEFRKLKIGSWFKYRSAIYLKLNAMMAFKITGKSRRASICLFHPPGEITKRLYFVDLRLKSLVTPVKISVQVE